MPMVMLILLTAKGTDGFSLMVGELPLYQMLLIFGIISSLCDCVHTHTHLF